MNWLLNLLFLLLLSPPARLSPLRDHKIPLYSTSGQLSPVEVDNTPVAGGKPPSLADQHSPVLLGSPPSEERATLITDLHRDVLNHIVKDLTSCERLSLRLARKQGVLSLTKAEEEKLDAEIASTKKELNILGKPERNTGEQFLAQLTENLCELADPVVVKVAVQNAVEEMKIKTFQKENRWTRMFYIRTKKVRRDSLDNMLSELLERSLSSKVKVEDLARIKKAVKDAWKKGGTLESAVAKNLSNAVRHIVSYSYYRRKDFLAALDTAAVKGQMEIGQTLVEAASPEVFEKTLKLALISRLTDCTDRNNGHPQGLIFLLAVADQEQMERCLPVTGSRYCTFSVMDFVHILNEILVQFSRPFGVKNVVKHHLETFKGQATIENTTQFS